MAANVANNLITLGCDVTQMLGQPSIKTRLIDIKSKQHITRIDQDIISEPILVDNVDLSQFDSIVISDYNKGSIEYSTIMHLRSNFDGPIFVDTKKTDIALLKGCIVKINEHEYEQLTSTCPDLVITLGENGAKYNDTLYPATKVDVNDVCGAGDTFLAALTYQYLITKNIEQSIKFAIKAATITVQHLGVYAPTLEQICD